MKEIKSTSTFFEYENMAELTLIDQELMQAAIEVRKRAYAPYSKFRVGAAILLDDGTIIVGSNQENAAFPSGLCAERTAIFYAGATHPNAVMLSIAISASSDLKPTVTPIPPCGACRQAILEYENKQEQPIRMLFMGAEGPVIESPSLINILPFHFDKNSL
ncbi:cytidine deaminase [Flavobacterium sp. NKUCC04_CG]|uniref:cytidine deaminase n=1 Tax=Flavobacterium sp. NKUCC04_CG TaxID=2842121 RepID=UPI001C5AF6D4|nr:cytidine deaminase [Flavobacterium sp. NKUCC04_CG]MBW3519561.1 cytidine deaminase [Flavobacterium sp. NKUCC04_CG]